MIEIRHLGPQIGAEINGVDVRRKGDIVIWDNRCSYHKAAGDYPPEEDRIHWRVSISENAPSIHGPS
jgi:alpha-ketoglutarate-dependent taurine dioxygenase